MEKEHPIRLTQEIKSKMSTLVFHLLFNRSETLTKKMDSNVLSWDIQSCDTVFRKTTSLEFSGKILFVKMKLGMDFNISYVTVPIEALVHPLCVIPDGGGDSDIYFVVLPKRNWSRFSGERIIITTNN
jgi:hypothetical protein